MKSAAVRSPDDVAEAIRSLSDADWPRLRKVAAAYTRDGRMEPEDLLQEAFRRAVDGRRNCPNDIDVVKFLAEAMRSIADGEGEKISRRPPLVPVANHGNATEAVDPPDPAPDPEQELAGAQEAARMKAAMLALFDDDDIAQIILEGMMEGMQGDELRSLTGLEKTAYESKRRLIRRRLDKKLPKGQMP